jgi:hypothetical protein
VTFFRQHAPLLIAAALAVGLESLVTVEWSFSYCSNQEDGPASAVFGFPLPYFRWGGFSSLIDVFMPAVYIANIFLLTAAFFLLSRRLVCRMASPEHPRRRTILGLVGATFLALATIWNTFIIAGGERVPVMSIADDPSGDYLEFRPVALISPVFRFDNSCTPSAWWFPDGWKHH